MQMRISALVIWGLALAQVSPVFAEDRQGGRAWASATIVQGERACEMERLAAKEVQRYLYRICGVALPIAGENAWREKAEQPMIVVGTTWGNAIIAELAKAGHVEATREALGEQGFIVRALMIGKRPALVIAGGRPVGVLYGAYTFLEEMGCGFYLGGDTFPGNDLPLEIPGGLNIRRKPVFAIRGSLPWYNFLNSPTTWDLDDFKYFMDQMSKMKNNFVGFHTYDGEPFAPIVGADLRVRPAAGAHTGAPLQYAAPLVTSLNYGWGTIRGLRTGEFGFGTGDYFDQELFGSRATTGSAASPKDKSEGEPLAPQGAPDAPLRDDAIRRAQALLARGLDYGRRRGVKVCVGFEVHGDPTLPENQAALEARLRELVRAYPMLDYVWLWQSEGLGGQGSELPPVDSPLGVLVQKERQNFEYLKDPRRIAEAVRVSEYIQLGCEILKRLAPQMKLIVSGWGGDKWMRFSDFYQGFDGTLPPEVIFAALDNIDPAKEPNVAAVYGKLSPKRERWPIPWWESDGGGPRCDQFSPQTNTKEFTFLCRDAQAKGCQGMLAIHWRTRDVEEVAAYQAQFAWEPALTYEGFYRRFAAKCFGKEHAEEMGATLRRLESLGPRWTGGGGQSECGRFVWAQGNRLAKQENLDALKEIRTRLLEIRREMEAKGRRAGLERISHLITTIEWVTAYDEAAAKLYPDGPVPKLIAEAEALKRKGAAADEKAQEAWQALRSSGLREAMRTFPLKMTTRGEFGALATINVKAYASYLELQERLEAVVGADLRVRPVAGAHTGAPLQHTERRVVAAAAMGKRAQEQTLHIVVKTPPTILPEKLPALVRAVVIAPTEIAQVTLNYRKPGEKDFHPAPMGTIFRKTYEGVIPADAVTQDGIEFFIEARDAVGNTVYAPMGYPAVTYSASVMPYPDPSVFLTQCEAPRPGQHYRVQAMVIGAPELAAKTSLRYRPARVGEYKSLPMKNLFYDSFEAAVPAAELGPAGIVLFVEVETGGKTWAAPPEREAFPGRAAPDWMPPARVARLAAKVSGPYEVTLSWPWTRDNIAVTGYEVYRAKDPVGLLGPETLLASTFKRNHYDVSVRTGETYWYTVRARDEAGNFGAPADAVSVTIPKYLPPTPPANAKATPGRGKVKISWDEKDLPVVGYNVYRSEGGAAPKLLNTRGPVRQTVYIDAGLNDKMSYTYTVRAVDRGGQEGEPSAPATATPMPRMDAPVFVLHFEGSPDAEGGMKGKLEGLFAAYSPGIVGKALDLTDGGWVKFNHNDVFDINGETTLEAWVKFNSVEGMPVFLSHGMWRERGFFVQVIGGRIRYHLGDVGDLDAGRIEPGKWYYIVCTCDMKDMRVYLNGREAGRRPSEADLTPWVGPFYVGRYTLDGKPYEVRGLIDEVKIYQRARTAQEIQKEYEGARK